MFKNIFIILGLILLVTSGYAQDGWNLQDSGTDRDVICVHFIDADTGWVAGGGDPATLLRTTESL